MKLLLIIGLCSLILISCSTSNGQGYSCGLAIPTYTDYVSCVKWHEDHCNMNLTEVKCKKYKEPDFIVTKCEITDIVQVSAGGFGSSAKCIYETTCGKLNLEGDYTCSKQIGEYIRKNCEVKTDWCSYS